MQKTWVRSLGQEDALEKGTATHSSVLAWRTPWTEEPGGLRVHGVENSQTRLTLHFNNLLKLLSNPLGCFCLHRKEVTSLTYLKNNIRESS